MGGENRRHLAVRSNKNVDGRLVERSIPLLNYRLSLALAGQLFAGQFETVKIAQNCYRDIFRTEKVIR